MELYNTCARLIERGKTNGMQRKLDIFFANDRLTEEEYEKLCTQLAEKLKEQGFQVARRTVAKYREQLGVPPAHKRK